LFSNSIAITSFLWQRVFRYYLAFNIFVDHFTENRQKLPRR
jgi:hypothetical protein